MHRIISRILICLPPVLLIGGCLSMGGGLSVASPRANSDSYQLLEQTTRSVSGCQYRYRVYQPDTPSTSTSVVLGHGFLRDQDNMIGLSRAMANRGIPVVTLDFCNMRPWNGHHQRNARDMRDLARALKIADDIVYGGFSAGALAAVLASDENTRAILALDMVDQADQGQKAIQKLPIPLLGLAGPPSSCNANSNGDALFTARDEGSFSQLDRIPGASHCDFESPSNWLCEVACGNKDNFGSEKSRRTTIINQSVESLLPHLGTPG
ncbi:MAG: alpha/beta hydrolase [Granulosicoccus sp.]